jgi:hypothetical protein
MTRKANTKSPPPVKNAATVAAPVAPVLSAGPLLTLSTGTRGRPDAATVDTIGTAYDVLHAAIETLKSPVPMRYPARATARMRRAVDADNAAQLAAFLFLKSAVANGRARSNGR